MKKVFYAPLLVALLICSAPVKAQPNNYIKVNLLGLPLNNYTLQYERILNRRFSAALSYRFMPKTGIPFKSAFSSSGDTQNAVETTKIGNTAITPEIRFYVGRGYGHGFYIAPFYRFAKFQLSGTQINYGSNNQTVALSGDLTGNSAGIMFGAQWNIGNHFALDWWIIGPHYGSSKGTLSGHNDAGWSAEDQQSITDKINSLDVPLVNTSTSVDAHNASLKMSGPWGGVRAGLCIGYRF
jgi:hypothetical protein